MLKGCNISKVCKQQTLLLMHDLQNIVRALKMSQHNKQREELCKLWGVGGEKERALKEKRRCQICQPSEMQMTGKHRKSNQR